MRPVRTVCVIVNYNDADTTIAQIERIREYKSLDAVIVVDNASTDASALRLRSMVRDKVIFVTAEKNGGYGAGNNLGIRYASEVLQAERALIANPDAEFTDACVAALTETMERHPELAALAPVQQNPSLPAEAGIPGSRQNVLSGAAAWPLRPWLYDLLESGPLMRRIFAHILHYPRWRYIGRELVHVDCVPGSLLMVDIDKFRQSGGYDEEIFLYEEEYVLGWKLRFYGFRTGLLMTEHYLHRHAVSIRRSYQRLLERQRLREAATLQYYRRYLEVSEAQLLVTRLFHAVVKLEARFLGRFL